MKRLLIKITNQYDKWISSTQTDSNSFGISPVIGIVLLVAIVVILAGVVGFFAVGLNDNTNEESQAGVNTSNSGEDYQIQIVNSGNTEEVSVLVNGREQTTLDGSAGESVTLSDETQLCEGDEITVIGNNGDNETVLSSETVSSDIDCQIQGTNTDSKATYDGSSWIVDTFLENTSSEEQYYVITLSNGTDQQVTETVTLQPGESTTVSTTESSYSESDPISVGILSPSDSDSTYSVSGGSLDSSSRTYTTSSSGFSYSGDDSGASGYYYTPEGDDGTTVTQTDSDSSLTSPDGSDEPALELSTSQTQVGDTVEMYATLTTTKSPSASEDLIVYATQTNTSSTKVSQSSYEINEGENKKAKEEFSISEPGEYVISATLGSSSEIHRVGTLTVVDPDMTIDSTSLSDETIDINTTNEVSVSATISNPGTSESTSTVKFYHNGEEFASQDVTLSSGGSTSISETYNITETGSNEFHIASVDTAQTIKVGETYATDADEMTLSNFSISPSNPATGDQISFNVDATHNYDENIVEYRWDLGNGNTKTTTGSSLDYTYSESGYYDVAVTAVDETGDTSSLGGDVFVPDSDVATTTTEVNMTKSSSSNEKVYFFENRDIQEFDLQVTLPREGRWDDRGGIELSKNSSTDNLSVEVNCGDCASTLKDWYIDVYYGGNNINREYIGNDDSVNGPQTIRIQYIDGTVVINDRGVNIERDIDVQSIYVQGQDTTETTIEGTVTIKG